MHFFLDFVGPGGDLGGGGLENHVQGVLLKSPPPLNFLSTRSHVNWPKISLSARDYTGILYFNNLGGGGDFSGTPCISLNKLSIIKKM